MHAIIHQPNTYLFANGKNTHWFYPEMCCGKNNAKIKMECNAQPENGMPALRNLMILLVPQRKMLGLETLQQGQDTEQLPWSYQQPPWEYGFSRKALTASQLTFASLTGMHLNSSTHLFQVHSELPTAWSARENQHLKWCFSVALTWIKKGHPTNIKGIIISLIHFMCF